MAARSRHPVRMSESTPRYQDLSSANWRIRSTSFCSREREEVTGICARIAARFATRQSLAMSGPSEAGSHAHHSGHTLTWALMFAQLPAAWFKRRGYIRRLAETGSRCRDVDSDMRRGGVYLSGPGRSRPFRVRRRFIPLCLPGYGQIGDMSAQP